MSPSEAISYVAALLNVKGVAVWVSEEVHAQVTSRLLRERLGTLKVRLGGSECCIFVFGSKNFLKQANINCSLEFRGR